MICGSNVDPEVLHYLVHQQGLTNPSNQVHYLDFPFLRNAYHTSSLKEIVNKLQYKTTSWHARPLSQVERLIMLKSVLLVMPIYSISIYKYPNSLIKQLHSVLGKFKEKPTLWQHSPHLGFVAHIMSTKISGWPWPSWSFQTISIPIGKKHVGNYI